MHSRIFKVQPDQAQEFSEIKEEDYYDNGFLDGYHDCVRELDAEETKDAYLWLGSKSNLYKVKEEKDGHFYVEITKESILEQVEATWERLKKEIRKPLNQRSIWSANNSLSDTSGFYFELDGCYYTEGEFLEELLKYHIKDQDVLSFRLEGSLDYHC